jgi:hypothetical protein
MADGSQPEIQADQVRTAGTPAQESRPLAYGPTPGRSCLLLIGCAISCAVSLIAAVLLALGVRLLYIQLTEGMDAVPEYWVIWIIISLVLLLVGILALVACVRGLVRQVNRHRTQLNSP